MLTGSEPSMFLALEGGPYDKLSLCFESLHIFHDFFQNDNPGMFF